MTKIARATLLLSLMVTAPALAQTAPQARGPCLSGSIQGQCIDTVIANAATLHSRMMVYGANRSILPVPPTRESGIADPVLLNAIRQRQYGLNATGPFGISGGGGANAAYGTNN